MQSILLTGMMTAILLLLTGCAGVDFVPQADKALEFGTTSDKDIIDRMGSPQVVDDKFSKYGRHFKRIAYFYASASAPAIFGNAEKVQEFYFYNGKLCGYDYKSSYKADHTDFDPGKLSFIMKGHDRKPDVAAVLGYPAKGEFVYPLTQNPGETADVYAFYTFTVMPKRRYSQTLIVTYNPQGVVTDVHYTQQGQPWRDNSQ